MAGSEPHQDPGPAVRARQVDRARSTPSLVVGRPGLAALLKYELVVMLAQARAGAFGLVLRKQLYPWLLGSCGRNVVFGQNVVLRHPHKIHIGSNVVIDDNCLLDAKGESNRGIRIGDGVFVGRNSILSCKNGDIELGDRREHRLQLRGVLGEPGDDRRRRADGGVRLRHRRRSRLFGSVRSPCWIRRERSSGVTIGDGAWLGAGAKVLDGVTIGSHAVIGAGAVVREDVAGPRRRGRRAGPSRVLARQPDLRWPFSPLSPPVRRASRADTSSSRVRSWRRPASRVTTRISSSRPTTASARTLCHLSTGELVAERRPAGRPGDQPPLSQLRRRPPARTCAGSITPCASTTTCGREFAASISREGAREGARPEGPDPPADSVAAALPDVTQVVAQSHTIQRRLLDDLGVRADVLWPPPPPRAYRCDEYGDYIFAVSRLTPLKRLDLLIRALAEPAARHVRVVIAGEGESRGGPRTRWPRSLGVAGRVTLHGPPGRGRADASTSARCRAVCFRAARAKTTAS